MICYFCRQFNPAKHDQKTAVHGSINKGNNLENGLSNSKTKFNYNGDSIYIKGATTVSESPKTNDMGPTRMTNSSIRQRSNSESDSSTYSDNF